MPIAPPVPCKGSQFCSKPGPYCEDHRGVREERKAPRGKTKARGYGGRWRKVRSRYLGRRPLCEMCDLEGDITAAEMVDHVIPIAAGGAQYDPRNLQSLCNSCHGKKTAADRSKYPDIYR